MKLLLGPAKLNMIVQRVEDMDSINSKDFLGRFQTGLEGTEKGLVFITSGVLIFLTVMIVVDVFLRFVFNSPLPASVESTELMMPYIVFFPLAYTLAKGGHVRISLFADLGGPKTTKAFNVIAALIGLFFCILLTYEGWLHFWESFIIREEMLAIIKLPWWVGKFAMPVGFFFMGIGYLLNIINEIIGRSPK